MKKTCQLPHVYGRLLIGCMLLTMLFACTGKQQKDIVPSSKFSPYINAYTGGIVSQHSTIRIELTQEQPMVELNHELEKNPFRFSPSLKGKTYWADNRTLEFIPEEGGLKPGQFYKASFNLGDFIQTDKQLEIFEFSFRVQESRFSVQTEPLTITSPDQVTARGIISFSDVIDNDKAGKIIFTEQGQSAPLHAKVSATSIPTQYRFEITGIPRKDNDYVLTFSIDASTLSYSRKQEVSVDIPAKNSFRFMSAQRIQQPENGVEIVFSEPLSLTQDLQGLIEIPEIRSSAMQIKNNKVYLYIDNDYQGKLTVNLHEGIKSNQDKPLGTSHSIILSENNLKPQVEFLTQAAILPDSKQLILPFRAVNLYAVDISVIRIYESNMLMFMQTNTMSSSDELRRSGRLVYRNTLWIGQDNSKNIHRWENYSVDLSKLIKQEPGALYRVILSFKQEYSAYPCNGNGDADIQFAKNLPKQGMKPITEGSLTNEEEAEWDIPYSYFYYNGGISTDWSLYKWEERDNPCHPSYYMNNSRIASCNVFASNVGMIVKRNSLNKLWITVNDILSTKPIANALITAYNFQLQPIGTSKTDAKGFAEITPKGVPFLATATVGTEKAYIRIADGEEQSTSRFDVGGKDVQKGLKGFVYGERGVWRPGDTLHISFILEDKQKRIPDKHPASLELYTPRGQFYAKYISTQGLDGFHTFLVPTRQEDPTGLWHAYVKVGGSTFHKSLRIETVKPNRLKINLRLPQSPLQASTESEIPVTLTSAWLTGATASNLSAKVELSLSRVNTQFKNYEQYIFNNPASDFSTVKAEVFDGKLDNTGKADFLLKLPQASLAPGMLNATLTTRVFEPGGDASVYIQNASFSPFTSYVGIRLNQPEDKYLETDKEHTFDIVTLTPDGRLTNRQNLEYKIYKVDWNWWWEDKEEAFGTYVNSSTITPVKSGNLQTEGGKAHISFQVNYPDWGRYLVYVKDRESGHAAGGPIYIDWPEWRGRSSKADPSNLKMLTFTMDKDSYAPGEQATAIIPASAGGRALVTLENGSTILHREWIEMEKGKDAKYSFKITSNMAPNVYLHVSLLQPHAQTTNDLPIRMYGVMPVFVRDPQTILHPHIDMPATLRPETNFQVTVSEKEGKPMTYTLAIVDDGLLDLTNFKTPDPWSEFYAREALGIRTWDMYDDVLGAKVGRYPAMFSIGGDETLKPSEAKANRFKPVVRFIGPFYLEKGKRQTHTLRLPMYVGSVRAMVVAGHNGAYGKAEKTVQVRTPLMILSTLPRVLSTQEDILVPVNLFAMEKEVKTATVSIEATDGIHIEGNSRQSVSFKQPGDTLIYFTLKTGNAIGKATIRLMAQGGKYHTQETIEIDVRNPNPYLTSRSGQWIEPGQSTTLAYALDNATSPESNVRLEISRIPSIDLSRRFDFLYNYAHQCTEQLTSKILPLLYLDRFKELDETEKVQIKTNVQEGIGKLYTRQLHNGGFAYWPGDTSADEWITSYVGMFLTLATEEGYAVQPSVLTRWKDFQSNAARLWRMETEGERQQASCMQQAFRLYTLALAGAPEHGAMNRMKEQLELPLQARWVLAAAYAIAGQEKAAGEIAYNLSTAMPNYSGEKYVYESTQRDEALVLEALVRMNRHDEALTQARRLSETLKEETMFDTQSTAFALMAMGHLAEDTSGTLQFIWQANKGEKEEIRSAKTAYITMLPQTGKGKVTITNQGEGAIDVEIITRTQPVGIYQPALSHGLGIEVRYTDAAGRQLSPTEGIKQGTDFIANVMVSNLSATQDYANLALTHLLPSGWEVQGEAASMGNANAGYDYRDVRDDRVLTYFSLRRGERKSFSLRLQATYAGTFTLPSVLCEDMYDPSIMARTRAEKTQVTR